MYEPFLANKAHWPLFNCACTHLQDSCYEGDLFAKGNSRWWTGPEQLVYWVSEKWSCECCARREGLLW